MKLKITKATFVLLFGIQCSYVFAQNKAIIDGTYTGTTPNSKVQLLLIKDTGERSLVDSALVDKNAKFHLEPTLLYGGGFYTIEINKIQKNTLILEKGEKITITTDGLANGKFEAKGSKNVEYYKILNELSAAMKAKVALLEKKYQEAVAANDQAKQQALQQQYMVQNTETINKIKGYFPLMGTSLVALYATNFLNPTDEAPFLTVVAEKFEKTNPSNPQVTTFIKKTKKLNATQIGSVAPEIALKTPEGDSLKLSSLRGKYVLVDFWASWCGPCRRENPNVVKMYEKFKNKDFEILGVSLDQQQEPWVAAIKKDNLSWKHVSDLQYWRSIVVGDYGIEGIPHTVLLDKEGKIIAKNLRGAALETKLTEVLGVN
jgi:thiol-disulfide isomerase/thioredoxin